MASLSTHHLASSPLTFPFEAVSCPSPSAPTVSSPRMPQGGVAKARLRVKREIDELAAADAGEGSRTKSQRKGKAKQTRLQELAEEALLQAEAELRICLMDEQGIDPEADSDEDFDFDQDSDQDLDDLLSSLVDSNGNQLLESSEELESDDDDREADKEQDVDVDDDEDDDDDDDQARRLLDSLPAPVKHLGWSALSGDKASIEKLRAYLESVADSDESDSQQASHAEHEHESAQDSASHKSNDLSPSDVEDEALSEKDDQHSDASASFKPVFSNGLSLKRKGASSSDGSDASDPEANLDESDTVESSNSPGPAKRVKIAPSIEQIDHHKHPFNTQDGDSGSQDSQSPVQELESSDEEQDSDEPGFLPAESGSEFGDVDEGEAELERLLAMADQDADIPSPCGAGNDEENEPQSFSRIPPHELHRCLNIPDDPSRPMSEQANGTANSRNKKARACEPYSIMPDCPRPIEVFLKPGQMLYLPASWYHEVTSSSSPPFGQQQDSDGQAPGGSKVHMALNYWFHPPDALEFEPVEPRRASTAGSQGRASSDIVVPGLGVSLGESAVEHRGAGTGTHERPYRDAEVWDEVAYAVAQQIKARTG